MSKTHIRRTQPTEHAALVMLWERSVRATHDFLAEADIVDLRPQVAGYFAASDTDLWVLTDEKDVPIGFLGLAADSIAALFMDPAHRGQGGGRRLVSHAQELRGGALAVDVNEQNTAARGFYEALGFAVVGRSPVDDMGRPFPIVHMRRETPSFTGHWLTADCLAHTAVHPSPATPDTAHAQGIVAEPADSDVSSVFLDTEVSRVLRNKT